MEHMERRALVPAEVDLGDSEIRTGTVAKVR